MIIYSTDDYFMKDGVFTFDPAKLSGAHAQCLRLFLEDIRAANLNKKTLRVLILRGLPGCGKSSWAKNNGQQFDICVDNTNSSLIELAPYAAAALAHGHRVLVLTIKCRPEIAAARNIHGVPGTTVGMMYQRMVSEPLPPWWEGVTLGASECLNPLAGKLFP